MSCKCKEYIRGCINAADNEADRLESKFGIRYQTAKMIKKLRYDARKPIA